MKLLNIYSKFIIKVSCVINYHMNRELQIQILENIYNWSVSPNVHVHIVMYDCIRKDVTRDKCKHVRIKEGMLRVLWRLDSSFKLITWPKTLNHEELFFHNIYTAKLALSKHAKDQTICPFTCQLTNFCQRGDRKFAREIWRSVFAKIWQPCNNCINSDSSAIWLSV
jgi:hypothetical protein